MERDCKRKGEKKAYTCACAQEQKTSELVSYGRIGAPYPHGTVLISVVRPSPLTTPYDIDFSAQARKTVSQQYACASLAFESLMEDVWQLTFLGEHV